MITMFDITIWNTEREIASISADMSWFSYALRFVDSYKTATQVKFRFYEI